MSYRSRNPVVDRLDIALDGGGVVHVAGLSLPRSCGGIAESSFRRSTPEPRFAPAILDGATVMLTVPSTGVRAGTVLAYTVTLHNPTERAMPMMPCPGYRQELSVGTPSKVVAWRLNCQGRRALPAGGSLAFGMQLIVPADAPTGPAELYWNLNTDPSKDGKTKARVWITGSDIPCRAGQLTAVAASPATGYDQGTNLWQPKDSGTVLAVTVTNTSATRCTLQGAPTVSVTTADGKPLALTFDNSVVQDRRPLSPPQVSLAPGATARTVLTWHATWCNADPNPVTVELGLPSGGGDVTLRPSSGWTPPSCRGFDFGPDLSSTEFGGRP